MTPEEKKAKRRTRDKAYREANREKVLARHKTYREANREKVLVGQKTYREANRETELAREKAYREANPEKVLAREKAYRANLSDGYLVNLLTQGGTLPRKQVTPQLIELKRMQLQIHRATKTLTQTLKEKE